MAQLEVKFKNLRRTMGRSKVNYRRRGKAAITLLRFRPPDGSYASRQALTCEWKKKNGRETRRVPESLKSLFKKGVAFGGPVTTAWIPGVILRPKLRTQKQTVGIWLAGDPSGIFKK